MGYPWEGRALASETQRRKFDAADYGEGFGGGVDLGDDEAAVLSVFVIFIFFSLSIAADFSVLENWTGRLSFTYWAPASSARLIRSGCVIWIRTRGETPIEAMAAVALCMESSLMWPCSQSMIIPW